MRQALSEITFTPAPGLVPSHLLTLPTPTGSSSSSSSLSSSLSSRSRRTDIKFTHFLISVLFIETNTLLPSPIHSLHSTSISLLERAGFRFNSRYDLSLPRFIVQNTAAIKPLLLSHCQAIIASLRFYSLRLSPFVFKPAILEPEMPLLHTYLQLHHQFEFTPFGLPIVLLKYCPIIQYFTLFPSLCYSNHYTHLPTDKILSLTTLFSDSLPLNLRI